MSERHVAEPRAPVWVAGKRVLVIGGRGFIGSHLCRRLEGTGADVHVISRQPARNQSDGKQWWQADATDAHALRGVVDASSPDVIYHLASYVIGARTLEAVEPTFRNNLLSTVNVLSVAAEAEGVVVVMTGSQEEPDFQDQECVPCSPYAAAKWAGAGYARMFHALFGLRLVNLRLFMVYGPGQQDVRKLVPSVILSLLRGEVPQLSSGRRRVDWVYVSDVVEALIAAPETRAVDGTPIEVGSGRLVSVRGVVEKLVELMDSVVEPRFGALPDRPLEQERVAETERARHLLGWQASMSLEDGLRHTIAWYRDHWEEQGW